MIKTNFLKYKFTFILRFASYELFYSVHYGFFQNMTNFFPFTKMFDTVYPLTYRKFKNPKFSSQIDVFNRHMLIYDQVFSRKFRTIFHRCPFWAIYKSAGQMHFRRRRILYFRRRICTSWTQKLGKMGIGLKFLKM